MKEMIEKCFAKLQAWREQRWFKRNRLRLRNVAAWAVHHQLNGGAHDENTILSGNADRRIQEAADGSIS